MSTQTATKLMTAEEFAEFDGDPSKSYELIRGELIEMSKPGIRHGRLQARLIRRIGNHAEQHGLGEAIGESGYKLETAPDTVRAPDVAFFTANRLDEVDNPRFAIKGADLAVEINSPNDVMSEVLEKARWWLQNGTRQVWVVDDRSRTVTVYLPDGAAQVYGEGDTLVAEALLPGFGLPLAELFA